MGSTFASLKNFCRDIILLIPCISSCCVKKEEHNDNHVIDNHVENINKVIYEIRCDDDKLDESIRHDHGHHHNYDATKLNE